MYTFALLLLLTPTAYSQENPQDWPSSYNMGPYRHVYPSANISTDLTSCIPEPELNRTCPIFFQLIMSFGGSFTSSGAVPAIQLALDQINARPDLLPGYTLHYTLLDSQCEHTSSLDALHAGLLHPPTKVAVVGSGCSVATEPTAEISHYYNLVQVSCSSASTELMNRRRFRKHFQVFPADFSLAYGFFGIIHNSGWRKVSILVEDEFLFTRTMNELKRLLLETKINFTETRYEPDVDPFTKDPDGRIYVLSMYPPYARQILCKAFNIRENFRYPRNVFLTNGWYPDNWWEGSEEEQDMLKKKYNNCDAEQRKSLIPYTLAIINAGVEVQNYSSVSENEYTGEQIKMLYQSYLNASKLNVSTVFVYQLCYDAIWILAEALNNTMQDLQTDEGLMENLRPFVQTNGSVNFGLQHFTYSNPVLADNIYYHLSQTNFKGIVGNIAFNKNGSRRVDTVDIYQYRHQDDGKLEKVLIAKVYWKNISNFEVTYLVNLTTIWPEGLPYDGSVNEQLVSVHLVVTVIFTILGICGVILAVLCIAWNLYFRNKKLIRLTSPYLNSLIGFGAVILYLNMFVHIIPSTNITTEKWLCNLDPWLIAIGYSFCYGTILAKMCRVYYIFSNPTANKRPLTDWKLALFVLLLVIIDVVILSVYLTTVGINGMLNPSRVPSREKSEETKGVYRETYRYFVYVCNSESRSITLGVLYGYKALLQIVALVLAISIRKVQIKGLNDAKYIIAAIYATSMVTTVIIVSTYTLVELVNIYAVVFCLCLFIGTTIILLLVFIPHTGPFPSISNFTKLPVCSGNNKEETEMAGLRQDPDGTTVFRNTSDVNKEKAVANDDDKGTKTIRDLRQRVLELEEVLENKVN